MAILFKCECGALWSADDSFAGQEYTCQTCGRTQAIPMQSDEDCVMVYKSGMPAGGVVMTIPDLESKLEAREFGPNDLVLFNGVWQPMTSVFDALPEPLPPPEPEGEDIALAFAELPAIAGFTSLKERNRRQSAFGRKFRIIWFSLQKSIVFKIALWTILSLVVLYGLGYGGCLLWNKIVWRPAYLVVLNGNDFEVTAKLGSKSIDIPANASGTFADIFVPWKTGRALTILEKGKDNTIYSAKPYLIPSHDVAVNPSGKYAVFNVAVAPSDSAALEKQTEAVFKEIGTHKAPVAISRIEKELRGVAEKSVQGKIGEEILYDDKYALYDVGIQRSEKYQQKAKEKSGSPSRIRAIALETIPIVAGEIQFEYNLREGKIVEFPLTSKTQENVTPFNASGFKNKQLVLFPAKMSDSIVCKYNGNELQLTTSIPTAELTLAGVRSKGAWSYDATRNALGQWAWNWTFKGTTIPKNKKEKGRPTTLVFESANNGMKMLK